MLRIFTVSLFLFFSVFGIGIACKCEHHVPDFNEAYQKSDSIFLGRCIKAEFIEQKGADPAPEYYVQYTFHVRKAWKGVPKSETILVKTGIGSGDCGWAFRPGFSYIIYGSIAKDSVLTNTCTRTLMAGFYPHLLEDAKTEIQTLDSMKQ